VLSAPLDIFCIAALYKFSMYCIVLGLLFLKSHVFSSVLHTSLLLLVGGGSDDDIDAVVTDGGDRQVSTCCVKRWKKTTMVADIGVSATRGTTSRTRRQVPFLAQLAVHGPSFTSHVSKYMYCTTILPLSE